MICLPCLEPYPHPVRCRRLWPEEAKGLSQEGPGGPAERAVVEGRADQRVLLFEEKYLVFMAYPLLVQASRIPEQERFLLWAW